MGLTLAADQADVQSVVGRWRGRWLHPEARLYRVDVVRLGERVGAELRFHVELRRVERQRANRCRVADALGLVLLRHGDYRPLRLKMGRIEEELVSCDINGLNSIFWAESRAQPRLHSIVPTDASDFRFSSMNFCFASLYNMSMAS